MNKYNTIHYNNILKYIKCNKNIFLSSDNIVNHFKNSNIKIGTSTIYRVINRLCDEKQIRKDWDEKNNQYVYQYISDNCHSHYHLKCNVCNTLFHIDCSTINNLIHHIKENHNFNIDPFNSVLKGTCNKCKKESSYE